MPWGRLTLQSRQTAGWQGSLFWREGKLEGRFRSVLERMRWMDSASLKKERGSEGLKKPSQARTLCPDPVE